MFLILRIGHGRSVVTLMVSGLTADGAVRTVSRIHAWHLPPLRPGTGSVSAETER